MESVLNYSISDILEILGEVPQSEGLHVYFQRKEITEIPFAYPYRSENYTIHFVAKGQISIQLNLIDYNLKEKDLIVIPAKTVISFNSVEQKTELVTVSFSLDFALKNSLKNEVFAFDLFASKLIRKLSLTEEHWNSFMTIALFLEKKNSKDTEELFRKEMISHAFNLFLYELAIASKNNNSLMNNNLSRKEDLTLKFLKILALNFKSQRLIDYYSETLAVSSSYLTKAVKSVTGKTIGKLIEDSIITEAKILLADTTLSISQISDELQFSDQSFFGKFFKRRTGFNPTDYRNKRIFH